MKKCRSSLLLPFTMENLARNADPLFAHIDERGKAEMQECIWWQRVKEDPNFEDNSSDIYPPGGLRGNPHYVLGRVTPFYVQSEIGSGGEGGAKHAYFVESNLLNSPLTKFTRPSTP